MQSQLKSCAILSARMRADVAVCTLSVEGGVVAAACEDYGAATGIGSVMPVLCEAMPSLLL